MAPEHHPNAISLGNSPLQFGEAGHILRSCHINSLAASYLTHYVIVRADLPRGNQAAPLIHAAGHSSPGDLDDTTYAVALTVKDEASLRSLAATLRAFGLLHHLEIENDPPYSGQAMALGIAPMPRHLLKRFLHKLPLLK